MLHRPPVRSGPASPESGAALLLAFLVLIVLVAIVYQINTVTQTDARVTRNEITRSQMDHAIKSVLMQMYEDLAEDGRGAQASEEGAGGAGDLGGDGAAAAGGGEEGGPPRNPDSVDSQMDRWFTPQSTNFGDIQIRIFVRDENSKYNVLNMLNEDEELAEDAFQRVVRILVNCRGETDFEISQGDAEEMATAMRDYMIDRRSMADAPSANFLTGDEENEDRVLPLSFREFRTLEPFEDNMFRDFFSEDDERIHSLEAYFTVFSSPAVGSEEVNSGVPIADGGWGVNVNTAPHAVLSGLIDGRELDFRIWDEIREYRNEEEEPLEEEENEDGLDAVESEPLTDEFGEDIIQKKIFDSLDELDELNEFKDLGPEEKTTVRDVLAVESQVFEIILAARISTAADAEQRLEFETRREQEEYFRSGKHLVRIVRSVVWRRSTEDDVVVVPLIPWEVIDNAPLQVLDYPPDE